MQNRVIITICLALVAIAASAQTTFLDKLRKNEDGKGKVIVEQSAHIDSLVNGTISTTPAKTQHTAGTSHTQGTSAATGTRPVPSNPSASHTPATPSSNPATSISPSSDTETAVVVDTRKKVMRNSYKVKGYRIQVFSGGNSRADRQKAERTGTEIKARFPNEPIYVHFYSPSWKCRMGNYRELSEAQAVLRQLKAMGYTQACIVKGTISVQY